MAHTTTGLGTGRGVTVHAPTLGGVTFSPAGNSDGSTGARQVLLGVSWSGGEPTARVRHLPIGDMDQPATDGTADEPRVVDTPLRQMRLAYRVPPGLPLHCLGSSRSSDACDKPVQHGSKRCVSCSIAEALHASSLHHAHNRDPVEIDPEVRRHLDQPNDLYLAAFRDGSVKVGTSSGWRTDERLTEQGAWLALIVARAANGYDIRVLEDTVTLELGLPQSVNSSRKVTGFIRPVDDATLWADVSAKAKEIKELRSFEQLTIPDTEIRPWENRQAMAGPFGSELHRYPHRLDQGAHDFEIVDVCGRVAAVVPATTDDVLAVDLGRLLGVEREHGHFETDEIALQGSLF